MSYEEGSRIIYAEEIDLEIQRLQEEDTLEDWEEEYLRDMLQFRQDARDAIHVWEDGTSFILESHFSQYAEDEAVDLYGKDVVIDSGYFDLDKWTENRRDQYQAVRYGNSTYYADGS